MGSIHTRKLEALLQSSHSGNSPEVKTELARLSAMLKERVKTGASASYDVFNGALAVLAKLRGSAHVDLRMECLCYCGDFFYTNGFAKSALHVTRLMESLSSQSDNKYWLLRTHMFSGVMYADVGDIPTAIVNTAKALSLARELGDRERELKIVLNLGAALFYGGLLNEGMSCFEHVANARGAGATPAIASGALANVAQIHLYNEKYGEGLAAIASSLAMTSEPTDAGSALTRTICEFLYVQLALGLRQIDLARKRVELCKQYSRWGDSKRSEFLASVAEGLFEIHGGDVTRGLLRLEEALITTDDWNHARVTCLTALVKGCDEAGRPEQALSYIKQLLDHVKADRERSILTLMDSPAGALMTKPESFRPERLEILEKHELKLRTAVAEREVLNSRIEVLERLAITADIKEEASGEHGYRVGKLASLLAETLNWSPEASESMEFAARLHDLGKLGVPDRILLSSQTLKEAERHFISAHTLVGAELLAKSNIPQLRMAEDIARYHHEWWDGTGYPAKLAAKRIPIHARIVALADVFDALTHGRPYAEPWPMDRAVEEIRNRRGTQFDPELTDIFLDLIKKLREEHEDLDAYLGKAGRNSAFLQARNKIRQMLAEEQENERRATVAGNDTRH